jgi:hypothetical protein
MEAQTPKHQPLLLYVKDLSELLKKPIPTIYNQIHHKDPGIPQPRYVGKHPVWIMSEVMAFVANLPTEKPHRKKPKLKVKSRK